MTFVAPNLAWGEARGASTRAPGASPASGAVTDEHRSPRPNSAQPFGRRFFSAPAALLAPYGSTGGICSSLAPCRGRKLLAANATGFTPMTTKCLCKKIRLSGGILTHGRPQFEARQIRSPKSEARNKFKIRTGKVFFYER